MGHACVTEAGVCVVAGSDDACTAEGVRRLLLVGAGSPVKSGAPDARALDLVVTGSAYSWSFNRSRMVNKRSVHWFRLLCIRSRYTLMLVVHLYL